MPAPSRTRPLPNVPGLAPETVRALFEAFRQQATEQHRLSQPDAQFGARSDALVAAFAGQTLRLTPGADGMRLALPAPGPENIGESNAITLLIESPRGPLDVYAVARSLPNRSVVQSTVNGHPSVRFESAGVVRFYSNGVNAWLVAGELATPRAADGDTASEDDEAPFPFDAAFLLQTQNLSLPNARVTVNSTEISFDYSSSGLVSLVVNDGSVVLTKLEPVADDTVLVNISGSSASPSAVALANFAGEQLTYNTSTHAFDWDGVLVRNDGGENLTARRRLHFVSNVGVGLIALDSSGNAETQIGAYIPTGTHGDIVVSGTGGSVWTIDDGVIDVDHFAAIDAHSFIANPTDDAATPVEHPFSTLAGDGLSYDSGALSWDGVSVRENSGGSVFTRRRINLVEGSNISIGIFDDSVSDEVDIQITATNTTYSAGDGIDLSGTTFLADVSDFAGAGLEDDGSNNLRIAAAAAGAGLTGGGGSALAVGEGTGIDVSADAVSVDPTELVGGTLTASATLFFGNSVDFTHEFDTGTTSASLGIGDVRVNNTAINAVTEIYIHNTQGLVGATQTVGTQIQRLDANTSLQPLILLQELGESQNWALFALPISGGVSVSGQTYTISGLTFVGSSASSGLPWSGGDKVQTRLLFPSPLNAASQADQEAGTSTIAPIVPAVQHHHPSAAKAWAILTWNGASLSVAASYNVSGASRVGAGVYQVNWDTDFSSANYAVVATAQRAGNGSANTRMAHIHDKNAGMVQVATWSVDGAVGDSPEIYVAAYGDQ